MEKRGIPDMTEKIGHTLFSQMWQIWTDNHVGRYSAPVKKEVSRLLFIFIHTYVVCKIFRHNLQMKKIQIIGAKLE
jgi:hypothetical protein